MPFQSAVFAQMGFGVVGELADDSGVRSLPCVLNSADPANNVFGRAFTTLGDNVDGALVVRAGNPDGLGVFAGFLSNPKASTTAGTLAGGSLAPTLTLPNNVNSEVVTFGHLKVALPDAANVGDLVLFDNVTGELSTVPPASALPVGKSFAQATVYQFSITAASIAVIEVTNVPVPPT